MCGIAGVYRRDGAPVDRDTLVRMTRTLVHRGPDEEGYYCNADGPESRRAVRPATCADRMRTSASGIAA